MAAEEILLVEDSDAARKFLKTCLAAAGFSLVTAASGAQALRAAQNQALSLVLLDLGLPDMNGLEVLRRLREWTQVPIIIVSVCEDADEIVKGLEAGANDFLVKPLRAGELLARVRAVLRRAPAPQPARFRFGPLELDYPSRRAWSRGREVMLTPTECRLLRVLASEAGRVFTYGQLYRQTWGQAFPGRRAAVRFHIRSLRQKLEDDPRRPKLILTATGVGYRLSQDGLRS
ncbi:MAG: response regulator transcription factor [Candidatus Eremiobacteraeota bacterium]|nr:response regulator transcription factor [Candidatus Eremiobacteraeota bacterium]